jgi:protein SCO1/2
MNIIARLFCACVVSVPLCWTGDVQAASGQRLTPDASGTQHSKAAYLGGLVTPPLPKPKFTLTDTSGAPFDFWSRTEGYVTLLFFGYARCPDQCPLHLENIAMTLKRMPTGLNDRFKLVFVTTDPERDTPHVLRSWLDRFDRRFVGLTGSEKAIEAAQRAAGVPPARKTVRARDDYAVGHANVVLAYTTDNLAHVIYPGGLTQMDWAHDLPQLLTETWSSR